MNASPTDDAIERAFFAQIPHEILDSFSHEQLSAIRAALRNRDWAGHRIDVRGTVRLPFKRWYSVFIAGHERRDDRRPSVARWSFTVSDAFDVGAVLIVLGLLAFLLISI